MKRLHLWEWKWKFKYLLKNGFRTSNLTFVRAADNLNPHADGSGVLRVGPDADL